MKGIKSLSSRNLAFRGYNWQLKQEINRLGASANQVLWAPEEDFNNLRIFQRPSYIALLLAQNLRLVIFEQSGFRKMIWYIRAIFLNQQTYKDSCSILERKSSGYDLVFPFPATFNVPIFSSFLSPVKSFNPICTTMACQKHSTCRADSPREGLYLSRGATS